MGTRGWRWWAIALFAGPWACLPAQNTDYGAVHGAVLRYDGTPLSGGEVELRSREEDFTGKVGPDGKFSLHARPGIYSLKITHPAILPFQRAQIVIRAGGIVNLNVHPVFHDPDPGLHYYSFSVPGPIELGAVMRHVDLTRPDPGKTFGQDYPMLSYDSLSVYAQKLDCDRRSLSCRAEGDVLIEIGTEEGVRTERASRADIGLTQRTITLTREESTEDIRF
jgi:hypothetical protein